MGRMVQFFKSNRLAAVLIASLVLQILLSAVIPQQEYGVGRIVGTEELLASNSSFISRLQLDRIYSSLYFQVTLVLLGFSLLAGNQRRLQRFRRLRSWRARWRTSGSLVFHFSLLLVVAGVFLNSASQFDGVLGLTEGQIVYDRSETYLKTYSGLMHGERYGRFELKLMDLKVEPDELAYLEVTEGREGLPVRGTSRINHPLRWQGLEFHLGSAVGYSPEIVLWDEHDEQILRTFVRVHTRQAGPDSVLHEDYLDHLSAERRLRIHVLPDPGQGAPKFDLAVMSGEEVLAQGRASLGDTLVLAGTRIAVPRWRRWCYIFVVHNPWLNVVFVGFWLALAGQAVSAVARVTARKGGRDE